jgi:hypothetical protein
MAKRIGPCKEDGCERPILARGLCSMHYKRWQIAGGPAANPLPSPLERFWAKVDLNGPIPAHMPHLGPCAVWTASHDGRGYGQFVLRGHRKVQAHRWIWEQVNGSIPPGLEVCHRCDNPPCVRHLFLGTHKQNMEDAAAKGRLRWERIGGWKGDALQPCGTPAAYVRHKEHGEEPCDACRKAYNASRREWYRKHGRRKA